MTTRKITKMVQGHRAVDGAGVSLVRVLGPKTVKDFDPFLMLDSFDSTNPDDYTAGFPLHPHRGIETITYLVEGEIDHKDSLGNKGAIRSGQSQWMTAGSGILHEEMPKASDRMLGLQIWLNLPSEQKMATPAYFDIKEDMVGVVTDGKATVRVIAGQYGKTTGVKPRHIQATLYDVSVPTGEHITIVTKPDENVFIFLLVGDAIVDEQTVKEKTAILFGEGDSIEVAATGSTPSRFIFFSGKRLGEPVAWGGPIVMNSQDELDTAFSELQSGDFIKHNPAK